jgi:hypothetical protein
VADAVDGVIYRGEIEGFDGGWGVSERGCEDERVDGMFRGRDVDDVVNMLSKGELVKAMTVGWSEEEKEGLGEAVGKTLTEEERKNAGFPMVAWVAVAKK